MTNGDTDWPPLALDTAIHNFLHWKAAILPNIKAAIETDPGFSFAHAVQRDVSVVPAHGAGVVGHACDVAGEIEDVVAHDDAGRPDLRIDRRQPPVEVEDIGQRDAALWVFSDCRSLILKHGPYRRAGRLGSLQNQTDTRQ